MARDMFSSNRESNFELRGITKPFEFRPVISFRKESSSVGAELGVAVNTRDGIAVTDQKNHCVQIFNSDENYLRSRLWSGGKQSRRI